MPDSTPNLRPKAIVIGASAAGLFAAAALAEFADVTIIERDTLPNGPHDRRGVPQAHHAHLMWSGGVKACQQLLPGLVEDAVDQGARLAGIMRDMVSRAPNEVWFRRFNTPHRNLICSRPLLDHVLRTRVLNDHRITLREETTVEELTGTAAAVTGVRITAADSGESLTADLVVDTSGRGTRVTHWLTSLGLPPVEEREVNAGVTYATRYYKAPGDSAQTRFPLVNVQANPAQPPGRGGIIVPIEGNRWIITLSGTRGGEPTSNPNEFLEFALSLGDPIIGELLKGAEPLGDVTISHSTANRRRYFEKMRHWPDGFVALGDAAASYNPVYGHGLSVAAQCALALRNLLRSTPLNAPGTARRLQRQAAKPVGDAWDLAAAPWCACRCRRSGPCRRTRWR
ncbi:FAD-dependent monooxygenase, partial [Streptomyces sp. NPDC005534]|uniref:NAD(P)/FAD-dependent oxidoreductase n=1 Tax=Streptomyces sp. NPDC005534 TaxID=3155714 RepID=UPI003451D0D1